jgi:RNA polymerase sigma-70 factor (ECF subfamily)
MTSDAAGTTRSSARSSPVAETDLVAAARRDPDAFETIYQLYVDRIYRYCYARTGSRVAAEDATAQTFLKAFAAIGSQRGVSTAAWLVAIARNAANDMYRRSRSEVVLDPEAQYRDPALTPEERALSNEERRTIRSAIAGLRDDQRMAIELQLAGWSLAETAEAMGRSAAAVKMLRARAVARLRRSLDTEVES